MNILQQINDSTWSSLLALKNIRRQSFLWMMIYLSLNAAIFALVIWQLDQHQLTIKQWFLDYFFPTSWQEISEQFADYLFAAQTRQVIGNLILGASLMVAAVCLFPVKEKFSEVFEREASLVEQRPEEFPLWMQALEEGKLLLFYITAQLVILFIGYYPFKATQYLSTTLSYLFLFLAFAIDFVSPTLQRHRVRYARVLRLLIKRPLVFLLFGGLFSLPMVLLSHWILQQQQWSLVEMTGYLFFANIALLTLAIPAGTYLASRLMPDVQAIERPTGKARWALYGSMLVLLGFSGTLHAQLLASMHHKSQILKANYEVDWSSFSFELPSLSALLNGPSKTSMSFELLIDNPTDFDIVFENSEIHVEKDEQLITQFDLNDFAVPAGSKKPVTIKLDAASQLNKLSDITTIADGWRVDLYLDVWPGIPFIFNLAEPNN